MHVRKCKQCQKRNPPEPQPNAPLGTISATYPFEKVSWDIMGPLPTSKSGNNYILVVTDLFTKWVEAFPLREMSSITLATVLVDHVIYRFGVPVVLHSDQGGNLCSEVMIVPAVKQGRTKKLSSLWRGPYTILDKTSPVNYCIQLIGSSG